MLTLFLLCLFIGPCWTSKKAKDIRDYNDADIERLFDEWEANDDDKLPLDELPEGDPRKPRPQLDMSQLDMSKPEEMMKKVKKGQTLMMFVTIAGQPSSKEAEQLSSLWQTSLWNDHIQADRFPLEDQRILYMFNDGSLAYEAKDFLVEQDRCFSVQLEQQYYCGHLHPDCKTNDGKKDEL